MIIIRDENRIAKMKKRSQQATLVGFLFLIGGFVLVFMEVANLFLFQLLALLIGWILSQVGIYLAHRYVRSPRPDEILDEAVKPAARQGRMYHFILPAPHVLLTKAGPVVFNLKYQSGDISADGDKWKQQGIGFRRFFGQEGLGKPTREVQTMIENMAGFIRKNAPEVDEVPIGAMIVFTSKNIKNLNVADSTIPAMHFSKVKGFLKDKGKRKPIPSSDYEAIKAAFDQAADDLL
jgi:membrane protein implicated in regulation of membrane protease activity